MTVLTVRQCATVTLLATWFLAAGVQPARAAIITFTDRATFLAATAASDATGPLPNLGTRDNAVTPGTGTTTVGTVTFTADRWFLGTFGLVGIVGDDWTMQLPGADLAISVGFEGVGRENLGMSFAAPVFSAGFDFSESAKNGVVQDGCYTACVDSTFEVTLKNGAATVDSFMFNAPDDVAAFIGVWSTAAFTGLEVRELIGTDDDEYYGRAYTGTRPLVVPVPEPSTLALVGGGVLALLGRRRARHR